MRNNTNEQVQIVTPKNGWDNGVAIIKICLSACNLFPLPDGAEKRDFQPLRPLKALAVVVGSAAIFSASLATLRGAIFPEPISQSAPTEQRIGHAIGARYVRPVATGLFVGSKASLAVIEADFRASEKAVKATPASRKLSPSEVQMLQEFTGKTLLVDFSDNQQ
jgi:hypothetical protein